MQKKRKHKVTLLLYNKYRYLNLNLSDYIKNRKPAAVTATGFQNIYATNYLFSSSALFMNLARSSLLTW